MAWLYGGAIAVVPAGIIFLFAYGVAERRADKAVEQMFRDHGCNETTGEIIIVRSHKRKGIREWLSGFLNITSLFRAKARGQGSRHSSSGSRAATSGALVGPVTRRTPSSRSYSPRSSST